ncbi:hypothetical protein GHT06_020319 [Daphnia sinensis]|uniref:Uncharacterized protein n=1 Tax=Daphnia sinensis TaxID=1820382 RepID=A0AAD5L2I4_9CRUS|nr:hypothetical protein GHT06_020319 [Daphnia sinensis]
MAEKALPESNTTSKFEATALASSTKEPLWSNLFESVRLVNNVSLYPYVPYVKRIFISHSCVLNSNRCSVLSTDHQGILEVQNVTLPTYLNESQTIQIPVYRALEKAKTTDSNYKQVELVSSAPSAFSFTRPLRKLFSLQISNLEYLAEVKVDIVLLIGSKIISMPSMPFPRGCSSSEESGGGESYLQSRSNARNENRQLIMVSWNREWTKSVSGSITRSFFVKSAEAVLSHPPSGQVIQIVSGPLTSELPPIPLQILNLICMCVWSTC